MATVPVGPLAWEPLYATGVTLKSKKKKKVKRGQVLLPYLVPPTVNTLTSAAQYHTQEMDTDVKGRYIVSCADSELLHHHSSLLYYTFMITPPLPHD